MVNKTLLSRRSSEIIMILKGQHNLFEDMPEIESPTKYITDLAAFLSDDCQFPFKTYADYPVLVDDLIQNVVKEYFTVCMNPSSFIATYFDEKQLHKDVYNDTQCWCSALALQQVQNDSGEYINGFSKYSAIPYARKYEFKP